MRQDWRHVGSSAYLSGVRRHTLLRQLAEPPRNEARPRGRASGYCVGRAWRALVVLLSGRPVCGVLTPAPEPATVRESAGWIRAPRTIRREHPSTIRRKPARRNKMTGSRYPAAPAGSRLLTSSPLGGAASSWRNTTSHPQNCQSTRSRALCFQSLPAEGNFTLELL